jgi:predicted Fe-Mo cluster-binding NifX family protein
MVANPRKNFIMETGRGVGLKLAEFLISYKPDVVVTREIYLENAQAMSLLRQVSRRYRRMSNPSKNW